jgi:hypothetical protein
MGIGENNRVYYDCNIQGIVQLQRWTARYFVIAAMLWADGRNIMSRDIFVIIGATSGDWSFLSSES